MTAITRKTEVRSSYLRKLLILAQRCIEDLLANYKYWIERKPELLDSPLHKATVSYSGRSTPVPRKQVFWLKRIAHAEKCLKKVFNLARKAEMEVHAAEGTSSKRIKRISRLEQVISEALHWTPGECSGHLFGSMNVRPFDEQELKVLVNKYRITEMKVEQLISAFTAWESTHPKGRAQLSLRLGRSRKRKRYVKIWPAPYSKEKYPLVAKRAATDCVDKMKYTSKEAVKLRQGFPATWWGPSEMAMKWQSLYYPIDNTDEAMNQWKSAMTELAEYMFGMIDDNESAKWLQEQHECDTSLLEKYKSVEPDTGPSSEGKPVSRKPKKRRAEFALKIEKLTNYVLELIRTRQEHAQSAFDFTGTSELLPCPTQKQIAKATGLTESDVSRCLKDPKAPLLQKYWELCQSLDVSDVLRFKEPRGCRLSEIKRQQEKIDEVIENNTGEN